MIPRGRLAGAAASVAVLSFALTGCTATAPTVSGPLSVTFHRGVLDAERNSGSSTDQQAVRRAAAAALNDERRAFVVSEALRGKEPAAVLAAETGPVATEKRAALLGRARSAALANELLASFSFYVHQDFDPARSGTQHQSKFLDQDVLASSTFHVDQWQGVRVSGDSARVLVRGENRGTSWGGNPVSDAWAQYKLILHRNGTAPHGWRITHQQAASTAA